VATREQNEKEFRNWEDLPDGGKRYWKERKGVTSGLQRMVKIVDADENTLSVVREIYNDDGDSLSDTRNFQWIQVIRC
jgi:hypothetical protein